jgi:hypothetical protein
MHGCKGVSGLKWGVFGTILSIALLVAIPAMAQIPTGTILGTVKDASGGVVAGATVTATNAETTTARTAKTEEDGSYRFSGLPVGHYEVKVEQSGFKVVTQRGLTLDVGDEAVVNFALEVGTAAQEVVVTSEAPQVNTTSGTLGGLVNEEKIADLPLNGRNYLDLTLLQPGVTKSVTTVNLGGGTLGTIYSSNGAPITSNNYLLDGAPMQTMFALNGASAVGTSLGVDGIREYKVVTNAFGAEYGMTMGSQMTIVSKSGSNQWHGDAFDYLRNRVMDARNYFDLSQAQCEAAGGTSSTCPRNPEYQRNNFGGAGGGPIIKDKTFVWATFEGLRQIKGGPILETVPGANCHEPGSTFTEAEAIPGAHFAPTSSPAVAVANGNNGTTIGTACDPSIANGTVIGSAAPGSYPGGVAASAANIENLLNLLPIPQSGTQFNYTFVSPESVNFGQIRVDQNISASDSFFGRYTIDNSYEVVAGQQPAFAGPEISETSTSRDQYLTLAETHIFSPALLNTARISYSRTLVPTNDNLTSALYNPSVSFNCPSGAAPCYQGTGDITIQGPYGIWGPDNPIPNYHLQNLFSLSDDAFYSHGKHALKFGFLGNRFNVRDKESAGRRGGLTYSSIAAFVENAGAVENVENPGSLVDRTFNYYTYGFYLQDDYRVTSRLTLNLGLRYEFNTSPTEAHGLQSAIQGIYTNPQAIPILGPIVQNPSLQNFSPRVGFAWDVFGDGKTAVHGAFGIYYDVAAGIGQAILNQTTAAPPFSSQQNIAGQFYQPGFLASPNGTNPLVINYATGSANNPTGALYSNPAAFVALFNPPTPAQAAAGAQASLRMSGPAYAIQQPYLMQWNLTVDRQLPGNMGLSVGYIGTRGVHLWENGDNNPCLPTNSNAGPEPLEPGFPNWYNPAGAQCPIGRFDTNFNTVAGASTHSESWYNGLQVSLTRKLQSGWEFQTAYTYSKAEDTTEGLLIVGGSFPTVNYNLGLIQKGPSQFDATQNLRFNTLYHVPNIKSDSWAAGALKGWWVGNIVSAQSGYPFSVNVGTTRSGSGQQGGTSPNNADFANLSSTFNAGSVITHNINQWYNPTMFEVQPEGYLGDEGRDILRGPRFFDWDFSVNKDTRLKWLGEAGMIEFRAELFNILNHPNFNLPTGPGITAASAGGCPVADTCPILPVGSGPVSGSVVAPAAAGKITSTVGSEADSRDIQLALKLIF